MPTAKLLLVENDRLLASLLPLQLTKHGYQIVGTVATGEDAIRLAQQSPVDLILMDIDLDGEIDGIAAGTQIRQKQDTPIIFMTSNTDKEVHKRVQAVGPVTCVIKPFTEKEIAIAIEFNLYRHAAERERLRLESEVRRLTNLLNGQPGRS